MLNPKKKKNMSIRSQTSSFLTNGSNQQVLKHAKMAKLISNKVRRGSREMNKGRSSSVKQENLGKSKKRGPVRNRIDEPRRGEEDFVGQMQFSERDSNGDNLGEEFARPVEPREPKPTKIRKMMEMNKAEECASPNEARKKTRKNCKNNATDTYESFRKKNKAKDSLVSTFKKDSILSLSNKLRLNSSAHQKVANMISIEISQDDLRAQPRRPEHCPSIEMSELLSSKNESQSKPSRERGPIDKKRESSTSELRNCNESLWMRIWRRRLNRAKRTNARRGD